MYNVNIVIHNLNLDKTVKDRYDSNILYFRFLKNSAIQSAVRSMVAFSLWEYSHGTFEVIDKPQHNCSSPSEYPTDTVERSV